MIQLHDLQDNILKKNINISSSEPHLYNKYKEIYENRKLDILELTKSSMNFDAGEIEQTQGYKPIFNLIKLPYPVTWVEFKIHDGLLGIMAADIKIYNKIYAEIEKKEEKDILLDCFNKTSFGKWGYIGHCRLCLRIDEFGNENKDITFSSHLSDDLNNNMFETQHYLSASAGILCQFLSILNCKNVKTIENKPGKFINQKRIKNGKKPILSFWTLHLDSKEKTSNKNGGTHSSPRLHLRRGHIREYKEGVFTWVNACVVGNNKTGIVHKDYKYIHDSYS